MKTLSVFLIFFIIFSLAITPIAFAVLVEKDNNGGGNDDKPDMIKGNNGFGNGNQDAPGNSKKHNNAENSRHERDYPSNSKHEE